MKKRIFALALALMLLSVPALAEEKWAVVEINGAPVVFSETKYENITVGFSFWYQSDLFAVLWDSLEDAQGQLMIHGNEVNGAPVFITVELPAKSGLSGTAYLEQRPLTEGIAIPSLGGVEQGMTESGDLLLMRTGYNETSCFAYYVIQNGSKELQLYTTYSLSAMNDLGVRISHLVSTFHLQ